MALRVAASTRPLTESTEDFDVALQTSGRASGPHPLVFTASEVVFPVCSPSDLAERRTPFDLADLPDHHLLHHKAEPQDWPEWDDWLERQGLTFRVGHKGSVFDNYPVMVQAARLAPDDAKNCCDRTRSSAPSRKSVVLPDGLAAYVCKSARSRPEAKALPAWLKRELKP